MQTSLHQPNARRLSGSACLVLNTLLFALSGAFGGVALAAGGYGPVSPGPGGEPGGFTAVVATDSFGTAGGVLKTRVGATRFEIRLPARTFGTGRVEVEITKPDFAVLGRALSRLGLRHAHVITGLGVAFLDQNGAKLPARRFGHLVRIVLEGTGLFGSVRVLEFVGPHKIRSLPIVHLSPIGKLARMAVVVTGSHDLFVVGASHTHG